MKWMLIATTLALFACLLGCDCEEAPDTWGNAKLKGCSESGDVTCCSYSGGGCSYVVCQNTCGGDWYESSWYCN